MDRQPYGLASTLLKAPCCVVGVTRFKDSSMVEGCRLVRLDRDNQSTRTLIAKRCRPVAGYQHPVWSNTYSYEENFENKRTATDYFCFPSRDCLLVAYDKQSLVEALARSRANSSEGLPLKLARWREEINSQSPVWGIRAEDCQITEMSPYYGEPPANQMPKSAPCSLTADWTDRNTMRLRIHGWTTPKVFERGLSMKFSAKGPGEFETEIGPQATKEEIRVLATSDGDKSGAGNRFGFMRLNLLLGFRWRI